MNFTENYTRLIIVTSLIIAAAALVFLLHGFTESGAVVTHLFYIPIILSTLWWRQRGLITPLLMAAILMTSHHFFLPDKPIINDCLRTMIFIGVGFVVARLSTRIFQTETELKNHRDYLEDMVAERTAQLTTANEQLTNEIRIRKITEQNLRESEARYRLLVETSRNIVIASDSSGNIRYMNPEGLHTSGYSEHEISEITLSDVLISDQFEAIVHPSISDNRKKAPILHEAQFLTKTGDMITIEVSSAAIITNHKTAGIMITAMDITFRKQIEDDHKKIEKLEAIGTLAGGIAHDFNNILMAIMGNVSMAKLYVSPENRISRLLSAIEAAAKRARDLTQQFLVFSPGGKPVKRLCSIAGMLHDIVDEPPKSTAISCLLEIAEDIQDVEMDPQLIRHAIGHIVTNAREAMPSGGILSLSADNVMVQPEQTAPDLPPAPGRYVRITVKDNGVGIPETLLPRIFDPYVSTKELGTQKGTGLGLTLVHAIIEKHQGHIQIQSQTGHGTTVALYLPASQKILTVEPSSENQNASEKKRILLMDDEAMICEITGEMLQHLGYDVVSAENSEQAIKRFEEALNANEPFDAALLDIHIPGGAGGIETLQQLKAMDKDVKAIASSGYSVDSVLTDYQSHGFSGCLAKPYRLEELQHALQLVIH